MVQDVLVIRYGDPESLNIVRKHADELAAVLVEPVQSRHPDLQPREFLQGLRELTAQSGIALIFDEVITGFRLHSGGAQAWFGVQADLATYGKALGGGLPIGAVAGKARFMDALDGGQWNFGDGSMPEADVTYFAGTFVRHPLAIAAASAVLRHLQQAGSQLYQSLNDRASRLAKDLNRHFEEDCIPIHIQQCGSLFCVSFTQETRFTSLFFFYLREKGIHI
jgi:glutamate-1-semialdehyde aminotransferase